MKSINNIYDNIVDLVKIQNMYNKRIRINTKNKYKLEKFENNYVSNMIYIKKTLENRCYVPGKYNLFLVKYPKLRLIMSQNIIDKVINHVVTEHILIKVFDKTLIDQNLATRKNKGTHHGIKLLKKYINEIKGETFYILKFDISKYFFNIDHDILKEIMSKKIKDKEAIKILFDIIDSTDKEYINTEIKAIKKHGIDEVLNSNYHNKREKINELEKLPYYKKGKGVPIGNMSSQFLAILYLNELDHYIKESLKIKYYIRYMDDGVILHKDKRYLEFCLEEIKRILKKYKLELNKKTEITKSTEYFQFLGYNFLIKNDRLILKVANKTKKKFKTKMKKLKNLLDNKQISTSDYNQIKASYVGHLSHGDTKKLMYMVLENKINHNLIKDIGIAVKIIDNKIVYENKDK